MGADACGYSPASVLAEEEGGAGGIISVGATDVNDRVTSFSNHGDCVTIYAPGKDIVSVLGESTNEFVTLSGTSMASPLVSGAVAVLLGNQRRKDTPSEMRRRVVSGSTRGMIVFLNPSV